MLRLGLKDLSLLLAAAAATEVPVPVSNVIRSHISGVPQGMGDINSSELARIVAKNAGLGERQGEDYYRSWPRYCRRIVRHSSVSMYLRRDSLMFLRSPEFSGRAKAKSSRMKEEPST